MSLSWLFRLILALAAIVVPATALNATLPCCGETRVLISLAGQLLVASPKIRDPHFDHAVILLVRHDQGGATGIVINRPVKGLQLASILKMLGKTGKSVTGKLRIFAGGPVQPEVGFVIHSADYRGRGTITVNEHVLMTSSSQILQDIGNGKGPKKKLMAFGYAGWSPYQLEDELQRHAWFTTSGDENLIFDEDREKLWDTAYARRTQDL